MRRIDSEAGLAIECKTWNKKDRVTMSTNSKIWRNLFLTPITNIYSISNIHPSSEI